MWLPTARSLPLAGLWLLLGIPPAQPGMTWEEEVGEAMEIGPTTEGYRRVDLRCASLHMEVHIETVGPFAGVIYTRGSYGQTGGPCFSDVSQGRLFTMHIPLDDCNTTKEGEVYTNTLILQHDDDLILPGDAAFLLQCDFTKPRDRTLQSTISTDSSDVVSRISLRSADPTRRDIPPELRLQVTNRSETVSFRPTRDEL